MFVVIYTLGPAWQTGKAVTEQPFFHEHARYMQQHFEARQVLMGGAFLDNEGGLGILDVEGKKQARDIVEHDPFVLGQVIEPHLHPWHAYFNRYKLGALRQEKKLRRKSQAMKRSSCNDKFGANART